MTPPRPAVEAYLDTQRDVLTQDPHGLYEGSNVHATRVAARRYRSVLRVFADLFDADEATRLTDELRWYAGVMSPLRDLQVLRSNLPGLVAALPDDLAGGHGALTTRIDRALAARERRARRALQRALVSPRRDALLSAVVAAAPMYESGSSLEDYFKAAQRTARRRLSRARRMDPSDPGRDPAMHRARKAAKRARYAAELSVEAMGKRASTAVTRWRTVQDELGEHQDGVVAATILRSLVESEDDFALGVLWAFQTDR